MSNRPAIDITIKFESEELEGTLDRLISGATNLRQPMANIAAAFLEETHRRFDEERDPLGVPWKKSKRAMMDGGKTLTETGQLRDSIDTEFGDDFAMIGVRREAALSRDNAAVGDYAAIHQFGGVIRPKAKKAMKFGERVVSQIVMPARPFLGFGKAEEDHVTNIIGEFLQGLLDGAQTP